MKEYDPGKPLVSLHIPKCGGSTFNAILKQWFGRRFRRHYLDEKSNRKPHKVRLRRRVFGRGPVPGLCIHGHFNRERGVGVVDYYPEVDQFITIMRDPVEVQLSNYFYIRRNMREGPWYRGGREVTFQWRGIDEYLDATSSFLLLHFPWELSLEDFQERLERYYVHVGVVERMQRSVEIMADRLGKPRREIRVINVSERDDEPSEDAVARFRERHPVEQAIYEWALKLNE